MKTLFSVIPFFFLALSLNPSPAYTASCDTILLLVNPATDTPPSPVTDLAAETNRLVHGRTTLTWTAPRSGMNNKCVSMYVIKFDTFSIDSLSGDTSAWWAMAKNEIELLSPDIPGEDEGYTLTIPPVPGAGTRYYFGIKSAGGSGISAIDTNASVPGAQASILVPPAASAPAYIISGRIRNLHGQPLGGIKVSLTGRTGRITHSNSRGEYMFDPVPEGSYSITPEKPGWNFLPAMHSFPVRGDSLLKKDFKGIFITEPAEEER